MISYSRVEWQADTLDERAPTLWDVSVALARLPRWNGSLRGNWSVAHHSLYVCDMLAIHGPLVQLAGLTHDAEEGLGWGDIAQPLKPHAVHLLQERLRLDYLSVLLGRSRASVVAKFWGRGEVQRADHQCAVDEHECIRKGRYMGHQGEVWEEWYATACRFKQRFEDLADVVFPMWQAAHRTLPGGGLASTEVWRADDPVAQSESLPASVAGNISTGGYLGRVDEETIETISICSECWGQFYSGQPHRCHPEDRSRSIHSVW